MQSPRIIIHMDMDYFFAQCEEKQNPGIKGKPVVICVYSGRSEDSGAVSTSNYEARKFGIKAGIPISMAKKLNPDAIFLPVKEKVGLTFSIGVAPNKLVAKIASDFQKPDGLTIVKPDDVLDFLAPLKITDLMVVGKKTAQRLNEKK